MEQVVIAVVGAIIALFGYKIFTKASSDKGQKQLEVKVAVIDEKVAEINREQVEADKETQEKVDAIDKDKNTELSGDALSDWFQRRK